MVKYEVIDYESCRAEDWVVVESGEDVKWKGQVTSKKGGQLRVRWLKVWEPEDDDELVPGIEGAELYEWDPYPITSIDVQTLLEIGSDLFHRARRLTSVMSRSIQTVLPGFEPAGLVYCSHRDCRCNSKRVREQIKEKPEDEEAPEETERDATLPPFKIPKRDAMEPATPALSLFEWEPNVMADVDSKCVPTHPFIYITKREQHGNAEKRLQSYQVQCACASLRFPHALKMDMNVSQLHEMNAGQCPTAALMLGRVIARLEVKAVQRKGHGIFAREDIKKGAFICEYVGEIISRKEANKRERNYLKTRQFFLHDIHGKQNHPSFGKYCLDPTHRGNIGRMINHSCQPNVSTLEVLFNTESQTFKDEFSRVPRVMFYAISDIKTGEELCIDYCPGRDASQMSKSCKCYCNRLNCKGWLF